MSDSKKINTIIAGLTAGGMLTVAAGLPAVDMMSSATRSEFHSLAYRQAQARAVPEALIHRAEEFLTTSLYAVLRNAPLNWTEAYDVYRIDEQFTFVSSL